MSRLGACIIILRGGIYSRALGVGEEAVDAGVMQDQSDCGGGCSEADGRGDDDDAPVPQPARSPVALPFDLEDDHAGEHEGEREEREGAEEVDEVAHEGEERGDEDVDPEEHPPGQEPSRHVVAREHALLQPLQPRVHGLVDRHREQVLRDDALEEGGGVDEHGGPARAGELVGQVLGRGGAVRPVAGHADPVVPRRMLATDGFRSVDWISGSSPEVLHTRMAATAPSALNTFSAPVPWMP